MRDMSFVNMRLRKWWGLTEQEDLVGTIETKLSMNLEARVKRMPIALPTREMRVASTMDCASVQLRLDELIYSIKSTFLQLKIYALLGVSGFKALYGASFFLVSHLVRHNGQFRLPSDGGSVGFAVISAMKLVKNQRATHLPHPINCLHSTQPRGRSGFSAKHMRHLACSSRHVFSSSSLD